MHQQITMATPALAGNTIMRKYAINNNENKKMMSVQAPVSDNNKDC